MSEENRPFMLRENMFMYKDNENIIDDIEKKDFYKFLERYGFEYSKLKIIFESEVHTTSQQNEFNIAIRLINKKHGILISDCVIYLGEFTKIQKIVYFLDDTTKQLLRMELSRDYNFEIKEDTLSEFIK